jgi:ubiquitin C-terminal hydrolase
MMMQSLQKTRRTVYTYRCNHCQQIPQTNTDFMEIILSFPQDKKSISLNELIHRDFGMERLDDKLCANCNNSDTSEVTTSIHTHPDVLIIMVKHHEYINNEPGRVHTRVNFPINGFVPNQGFDNVETTTEYDLFAASCHKESREKTSGHYTAQFKIKDSNNHWIEYDNADLESNNLINQRNRTKANVKYYPLVYILFYIKKSDAVSPEIGLQVQVNNGISQLLADDHNDE